MYGYSYYTYSLQEHSTHLGLEVSGHFGIENCVMQKWKIVYRHLNGFIEKQMSKMALKQCHKYSTPAVQIALSSYIQKNSLLVGYEESVLTINIIDRYRPCLVCYLKNCQNIYIKSKTFMFLLELYFVFF